MHEKAFSPWELYKYCKKDDYTKCAVNPWRFSGPTWEQIWATWSEQTLLGGDWTTALLRSLPNWIILWLSGGDTLCNKWNSCVLFSALKKNKSKNQNHSTAKNPTKNPHKSALWKGMGLNRLIHSQNRMKSPSSLKGSSAFCWQPCTWETNIEELCL